MVIPGTTPKSTAPTSSFCNGFRSIVWFFRVSEKQFTQRQAATGLISVPRLSLSLVEYICSVRALCA
jgi:hypothetical protein